MPRIIALGHTSRVGKDYCATRYFNSHTDKRIKFYKFSAQLKDIAYSLGLTTHPAPFYEQNPDQRLTKQGPLNKTVIEIWTELGPHLRKYDPYVWARPVANQLVKDSFDIAFITDLRYPEEVNILQQLQRTNFFTVNFIKLTCPQQKPLNTEADHALDNFTGWDAVIGANLGQLDLLYQRLCQVLK